MNFFFYIFCDVISFILYTVKYYVLFVFKIYFVRLIDVISFTSVYILYYIFFIQSHKVLFSFKWIYLKKILSLNVKISNVFYLFKILFQSLEENKLVFMIFSFCVRFQFIYLFYCSILRTKNLHFFPINLCFSGNFLKYHYYYKINSFKLIHQIRT